MKKSENLNEQLNYELREDQRPEEVERLLKEGADPNAWVGRSPTMFSLCANLFEPDNALTCLRLLLDAGADVNAKGFRELSLIQCAASSSAPQVVEALIAAGADVNAKDDNGFTALHSAAQSADLEVVELLIQAGADVGAKNFQGDTPLHFAAGIPGGDERAFDKCYALIEAGANLNAKNQSRLTPLQIAKRRDDKGELYEAMLEFVADMESAAMDKVAAQGKARKSEGGL